jgi:hypothetical protein
MLHFYDRDADNGTYTYLSLISNSLYTYKYLNPIHEYLKILEGVILFFFSVELCVLWGDRMYYIKRKLTLPGMMNHIFNPSLSLGILRHSLVRYTEPL